MGLSKPSSSVFGRLGLATSLFLSQSSCGNQERQVDPVAAVKVADECSGVRYQLNACMAQLQDSNSSKQEKANQGSSEQKKELGHLSHEQTQKTLKILEDRFNSEDGRRIHKGVEWARVKMALLANAEALWSINGMESQGHEPDVYLFDEKGFDIGSSSKESPEQGRNCVYDEEAGKEFVQEYQRFSQPHKKFREDLEAEGQNLIEVYRGDTFGGNAVEMAEKLGIKLMTPEQYLALQAKGEFDLNSSSWLETDKVTRGRDLAIDGYRLPYGFYVGKYSAYYHNQRGGWRGSLRINWAK